jgi:hypothetical protein
MPEEKSSDDVEKVLAELKAVEDRKQAVINDLLKQRDAAVKAFDEKLAKLGYHENSERSRRNHHKKSGAAASAAPAKPAAKPKEK